MMILRRTVLLAVLLLWLPSAASAQATKVQTSGTLPTHCTVGNVYLKTGASAGFYVCLSTDTWTGPLSSSSGTVTHTGTLTSGKFLIGNGSADVTAGSLTANLVTSSSGTLSGAVAAANSKLLGSGASGSGSAYAELTLGTNLSMSGTTLNATAGQAELVGVTVDGAGSTITTGVKGFVMVPITGTITKATLLSTDASVTSCSVVFDVWKDTYTNYAPTVADTITASAKPTLSSAIKSQDSTLTGWSTSVTAGDILGFNVDSVTSCTRVTLMLTITP